MRLRAATDADLPRCQAIWAATSGVAADEAATAPPNPLYGHELATGRLVVAEDGGVVVGFGAALRRSDRWFLADLFVGPDAAGRGVGRALLGDLVAGAPPCRATMASSDLAAQALYILAGMSPRWPAYTMVGALPAALPPPWLMPEPARADDPDLLACDARLAGVTRTEDLGWWVTASAATPLWLVDELGGRRGYAVVQRTSPALLDPRLRPAASVVTVRVDSPAIAADAVLAAIGWAATRQRPGVRLLVPGPHPVMPILLQAGFRITDVDVFCASHPDLFDPERDLPSSTVL